MSRLPLSVVNHNYYHRLNSCARYFGITAGPRAGVHAAKKGKPLSTKRSGCKNYHYRSAIPEVAINKNARVCEISAEVKDRPDGLN